MGEIRNAVRALIVVDERILFIKKELPDAGVYYVLPGGAQEPNETLEETLRRECEEELGAALAAHRLLCVREYISGNHEYSHITKKVHAVEFIYDCRLRSRGTFPEERMATKPRSGSNGCRSAMSSPPWSTATSRSGIGNMYSRKPCMIFWASISRPIRWSLWPVPCFESTADNDRRRGCPIGSAQRLGADGTTTNIAAGKGAEDG
ncbi:hypothetical protein J27TS7_06490 [Paenibacillus dendritiformis]|uniref:NUDIX domain-containing protein n=1 Tax=Paenibacillus dendritiformis TaxID=130049 RepID=UPI001B1FB0A1|nr:NUDIX domain-containing protein [Paenibacillus dendritiformis]GIO71135.1 hypothetical protein J27TS7_06490 [Paenibacillus dendritiformis]